MEKFLKAFLLSNGWRLRRIHDLEALLDDTVEHDQDLERFRAVCQRVTGYYLIERYPLAGVAVPSVEDVHSALESALELVAQTRDVLGG